MRPSLSPPWHRARELRTRARRAARRKTLTEEPWLDVGVLNSENLFLWTCPNCGVLCSAGRRKCTTHNCRTPKPKSSQDVEPAGAGMWACLRQDCLYSRNFAGREACCRCGAQRRAEHWTRSSRGSTSSARSSPSSEDNYLYNGQLSTSLSIKTVIIFQQHFVFNIDINGSVPTRSDKHACGKQNADRS